MIPVATRSLRLAAVAGLSLSLGGCMIGLDTKEQVTTIPVPHVAGSGLNVTAHNGHIGVAKSGDAEVKIIATLRMVSDERLKGTTITATRDSGGVLVVSATPPDNRWNSNEGCGFDITVPEARGVTLKTDNGRIEAAGLLGAADLETSNGSITVTNQDGKVHARTSNGRVEMVGVTGPVECSTSNGSVKVSLAPAGRGPVKIDTSNGAITLEIGKSFTGSISADTSNGRISTPDARAGYPTANIQRQGRTRAVVTIGTGPESTLVTSNGGITIKFAD